MIRRLESILALFTILMLFPAGAGAEKIKSTWHPAGYGGGGRFTTLAVDPVNPRLVYVGSDVAGVFRSRDGGNRFELIGRGLEGFGVADIAINPSPPHQLVALTGHGLHLSLNQGDEWQLISGEIRYASRFFGSRLLLFTRNSLWIGTDDRGVFRLPLDNLKAAAQPVFGLERFKVNGLAVYEGYLYAGTSHGVYRLEEQSWRPQNQGLPPQYADITDITAAGKVLYLLQKQRGLFRWNPQDRNWEHRPLALSPKPQGFKSLLVHPHNPDLLFIGSHPENWPHLLYKTTDGGSSWKSILSFRVDPEAPPNWTSTFSGLEEMAFVPQTPQTLLLADWWNLWQSHDSGEQWFQRHHGLQNTVVNDLKIHPRNPKTLYLCAADNGLMISEDGGKSWRRAMKGVADGHAQEMEISPTNPDRMFLLMNPWEPRGRIHVYESRDAGATWQDIGFPLPPSALPKHGYIDGLATNLELDPRSEETIYLGTNGYGLFKTVNAGKSWTQMNQGLATPYIKGPGALRIHPQIPTTLFASTQAGGIYKSTDGARSWQRVSTGGEIFTFGLAIDPAAPSRIVAGAAGNRLLISQDEGKSWRELKLPSPARPQMAVYAVAFHPRIPGLFLAGTIRYDVRATEGIFLSMDGLKTFRQVPMDIPRVNANIITMLPSALPAAYVGFNGTGIFRLELGEGL